MSDQYPPSFTPTSTVTFLEDEAAALGRAIEGINEELGRNERDRDHLRDRRAELSRAMVEMRVAANLLRGTGLRTRTASGGPRNRVLHAHSGQGSARELAEMIGARRFDAPTGTCAQAVRFDIDCSMECLGSGPASALTCPSLASIGAVA